MTVTPQSNGEYFTDYILYFQNTMGSMTQDNQYLTDIREKLFKYLPACIQVYNSVVLAQSQDGIHREIVREGSSLFITEK